MCRKKNIPKIIVNLIFISLWKKIVKLISEINTKNKKSNLKPVWLLPNSPYFETKFLYWNFVSKRNSRKSGSLGNWKIVDSASEGYYSHLSRSKFQFIILNQMGKPRSIRFYVKRLWVDQTVDWSQNSSIEKKIQFSTI